MRIVFDHGDLRLHVDAGDPLHSKSLETWREASELSKTCIDVLPSIEIEPAGQLLAATATHALTAGRDSSVIANFKEVERRIREADETVRGIVIDRVVAIFLTCLALGFAVGIIWILVEPFAPWNALPKGLDLAANYLLLVLGWTGFTLIGFSIGWFFLTTGTLRNQDRAAVAKQSSSVRQRKVHVAYNASVCLIIVILMFFFGGFELISKELSQQLTSAPWAILLGLVGGVAEPMVSEWIRSIFKLS